MRPMDTDEENADITTKKRTLDEVYHTDTVLSVVGEGESPANKKWKQIIHR
jgi:hypothetical protein